MIVGLVFFVVMSLFSCESLRIDDNKKRHPDHSDVAWRSEQMRSAGQARPDACATYRLCCPLLADDLLKMLSMSCILIFASA